MSYPPACYFCMVCRCLAQERLETFLFIFFWLSILKCVIVGPINCLIVMDSQQKKKWYQSIARVYASEIVKHLNPSSNFSYCHNIIFIVHTFRITMHNTKVCYLFVYYMGGGGARFAVERTAEFNLWLLQYNHDGVVTMSAIS